MKIYNKRHHTLWPQSMRGKISLAFAICFGIVMLVIGLSQIFAAGNQVYFSLAPTVQYANANDEKSVALTLSTYGQSVDSGQFTFTYDINVLSFVRYTAGPSYIHPGVQVSQTGSYSLFFRIDPGAPSTIDLGSITFKAKSLPATQSGRIGYDGTQTSASYGGAAYPGSYGQGAIVAYAAAPAATPPSSSVPTTTTPSPPVATPSTPTHTQPTPTSAPSNTNQQTPQPPTTTVTPTPNTITPYQNNNNLYPAYEPYNPGTAPVQPKKKHAAPIIFIFIGLSFITAGIAYFVYNRYFRGAPLHLPPALEDLHAGLFDDRPKISKQEETVITPVAVGVAKPRADETKASPEPSTKHAPEVITKSKERARVHHLADAAKKTQPVHALKSSPKPGPGKPLAVHSPAAGAKHVLPPEPALTKPTAIHPPASPPPLVPVLPRVSSAPSSFPPVKSPIPDHQLPAWQAQLKVPHTIPKDDLPDMFELAQEHPESFGSSQLYEAEHPGAKDEDEKDKK